MHAGKRVLAEVEGSAKVERNDLLPLCIREVDALVDMLHSCIVHKDIDPSEFFESFLDDVLAVSWLSQVSINVDRLGVGIFGLEFLNCLFDLFIRSKPVEDDVEALGSKRVGDSKANATERASYKGYFVVVPA